MFHFTYLPLNSGAWIWKTAPCCVLVRLGRYQSDYWYHSHLNILRICCGAVGWKYELYLSDQIGFVKKKTIF